MPPFDFWPLAFMALVPLYLAIREAPVLRAALIGWICGLAINVGGFFWGIELLEPFAHLSQEMSIVRLLGVCAYQGTVWLIWAFVCNALCRHLHLSWLIVAPLFLALLEAAIPMIFPWYLGFTVWRFWPVIQLAELGGPPAVSALLILINIILAEGVGALFGQHPFLRSYKLASFVVLIILCLGIVRSIHVAIMRSDMPTMRVGIVQPNLGRMSTEKQNRQGQRYNEVLLQGSRELSRLGADLVILPASAFPFLNDSNLKHENTPSHPWESEGDWNERLVSSPLLHPFAKFPAENSPTFINHVTLKQPNLLITLANRPWFGDRTAPYQALALATLRSVETRRDLVRATNNGASSIGDALGRIHSESPFYEMREEDYPAPILLVGEVALMEIFALGPYTAPFFPYACALVLAILIVARTMRELIRRPQKNIYRPIGI